MHEAIRADPSPKPKERDAPAEKKKWKATKLTYEERKVALKVPPLSAVGLKLAVCLWCPVKLHAVALSPGF